MSLVTGNLVRTAGVRAWVRGSGGRRVGGGWSFIPAPSIVNIGDKTNILHLWYITRTITEKGLNY